LLSTDDVPDNFSKDICEPEVAACIREGEVLVVRRRTGAAESPGLTPEID
jgi:hypothetical protein